MSFDSSRPAASRSIFESLETRQFLSGTTFAPDAEPLTAETRVMEPMLSKAATRTTIKALPGSSTYGGSVRLVATVTRKNLNPVPAGTITFKSGTTVIGTAAVSDEGKAVLNTIRIPVGTANLTAVFSGTPRLLASTSKTLPFTVAQASTVNTLTTTASTATMGTPVTYVAKISPVSPGGGIPTGTVEFYDGATKIKTVAVNKKGRAVYVSENLFKGTHAITAKFIGNVNYKASTSSVQALTVTEGSFNTSGTGLKKSTRVQGTGTRVAKAGDTLVVNYTGYLTNGTKFDSSLNDGRTPFVFTLGQNPPAVIAGWEQGFLGTKPGETVVLIVPPSLGYGSTPNGNIPANSTLYFIVQVLEFGEPELGVRRGTTVLNHNAAPSTANGTAFGSVAVNASSATTTFTLSNEGNDVLNFTANPPVVLGGSNAADFVLTQPVFSNGQASITVKFSPKSKGAKSAFVVIFTNDPDVPQFAINLSGTGT